jgi:hypothetical protein
MRPRILAESTGAGILRAYIESSLAFMREHRNHLIAIVEIDRNGVTADGQRRFYGNADVDEAVRVLEQLLARCQAAGELRPDFDPRVMAVAIRAAIGAVPPRLTLDPDLDIDKLRTRDRHHVPLGDPYRGHDVSPDLAHSVDGRRAAPRSRDGASATLAVHGVLRGHAVAAVGRLDGCELREPLHPHPLRKLTRPTRTLALQDEGSSKTHQVEVAGIEPASFGTSPGLLRAQPALAFLSPGVHAGESPTGSATVCCPA